MPRQKQSNPRGLKQVDEVAETRKDGPVEPASQDDISDLAKNPPSSRKRHHGKNKAKYKSAMKVKITDRVRQKREAKAQREKQSQLFPETLGALQVEYTPIPKQPQEVQPPQVQEIVKEALVIVPEVYKDKYDIIKERRARMSRISQEQRSSSPSKTAKEGVTSSPKKQQRQRHASSGSQVSDTGVSVLRNSESEEEGALKQQALEALLEITGKEFKSMNNTSPEQLSQPISGDAVVTPRTPPVATKQKSTNLKSDVEDSRLLQFTNNPQVVQVACVQLSQQNPIPKTEDIIGLKEDQQQKVDHSKSVSCAKDHSDLDSSNKQGKHVCEYCGRRCSKPSVLKKHIRSHTGERPYPCPPCGISFKTKSNLYKHCKSHAHAAKAGTSGTLPDLKVLDSENESGSDETDTDEEGKSVTEEQRNPQTHIPAQTSASKHLPDNIPKMTQASMQAYVNGGRTLIPESHPTFAPSSKSQSSPIASQTGKAPWEASAAAFSNSARLAAAAAAAGTSHPPDLQMLSHLSTDILSVKKGKEQRSHLPGGSNTKSAESGDLLHTNHSSEGRRRPMEQASPRQQESQQPSPHSSQSQSDDQIMIPLKNFNIVKSGGQYHFQIPVEGIPGLSEEVLKQQRMCVEGGKEVQKEKGEKSRPTLNSPSTQIKLQQHIQKLITQNEAIVDDSDLESVKPRRPSFSYRESMTSTPPHVAASSTPELLSESRNAAESNAVTMEMRRRSELAEQTNLDSKQEVRGNHDRQREAETLKGSQYTAHLHTGQPRPDPPSKAAEAGISAGHKLPASSPVILQQAMPGDSNTIRNILLQHKLTQQAPPASMLGQSLPMDRQQYSPLWSPAQMVAPWMLKEALQGGLKYPMPAMYHPAMMQHVPPEHLHPHPHSPGAQYMKESPQSSQQQHAEKSGHKRKKGKSESEPSGSRDGHHSRKRARKQHNHHSTPQEEEAAKGLPFHNAAHSHSMLPMFSPPFPGPDANQAASQLPWFHASLPKGTSTPLRSPYSPKPFVKAPEASFPGVSVIQHTPTTPHAPSQFPIAGPSSYAPDKPEEKVHRTKDIKSPMPRYHGPPGNSRGDVHLASPSLPHTTHSDGLLKVAPPQSPLTPNTFSQGSPMIPSAPSVEKQVKPKDLQDMPQMSVNEALARKKKSFTLALDESSARASLQKRRNLPAIPGLNMSPSRSVPSRRTPNEQTRALDLTAKIQSMGSPMSAKVPRGDLSARSPAYTPTEGGKKFPKSPMKYGAGAAARHRLSLDLQQPLTAAVKGLSTPDGAKPSPKIDPRVLLSPEALSIAESVMKMSQSPMKAKTPSTPVDAARELGRLVAHAFHNAGGSIKSVLTTSDEGVIVGPIATPTAEGKPQSKYFILPSPSSSHAPSFPSSSSPRSEKSPLTPSDSLSPSQGRPQSGKRDVSFDFLKTDAPAKEEQSAENVEHPPSKMRNGDDPSPVKQKPEEPASSGGLFTGTDEILKILTPVMKQSLPKAAPKKLDKSLADWFASVKTNKAGSGPALAPTFLYANISSRMKGVAQVTDCTSRRLQPMYVPQGSSNKISMYSNWRPGGNTKNPLGISWRKHLGLYNSGLNKDDIKDVVSSICPPGSGILTHSSAWNMSEERIKVVSDGLQKPVTSKTCAVTPTESCSEAGTPVSCPDSEMAIDRPAKGKEPKRIAIFEGGFKSNEEYVYVRGRGRGKYVCQECGIRCKKPSMLKKHIRTHTDVRPFQCSVCSFAFKTKGNLTKHMKSKAHTKKCLESGINPSDLEQEHGIDSSAYEDGDDHQYSDADDNEDTDSADEDSEEEEMDDGMDEDMEVDDSPQVLHEHHDTRPCSDGEGVHPHPKLKRSNSEILKPWDPTKDDPTQGGKLSRSEVVCKLSQHLSNRQRAHGDQDRSDTHLTKSKSLSVLPTSSDFFLPKRSSKKSQPLPVLDKYGHIVAMDSFVPCTHQYRLATGNSLPSEKKTDIAMDTDDAPLSGDLSPSCAPDDDKKVDNDDEKKEGHDAVRLPTESIASSSQNPNRKRKASLTESKISEPRPSVHSMLFPGSAAVKPHESLMRRQDKSDSRMRYYSASSHEMRSKTPPVIEPVSDDDEDTKMTKSDVPALASRQTRTMEASGNAIKQLLLSKPPVWPAQVEHPSLQSFISPFLPPSPSLHTAPLPSPTHLSPFSPGPYTRLVSPMLPSKMFQLPPTILPMHLPPSSTQVKSAPLPADVEAASSLGSKDDAGSPAPSSPPLPHPESPLKEKPMDTGVEDAVQRTPEEERLPLSPTGSLGHHRCPLCGETFIKPSQLRIHARVHTSEGTYTCHDCSLSFPTKYVLSKHERSEEHFLRVEGVELATTTGMDSNPRPFKCKECAIAFRIPGHLAKHLRSKGHLMTLERQGKLPAHKQELLHLHPDHQDGGEDGSTLGLAEGSMVGLAESKTPVSPTSSEKTDSASEAEEGKS